MPEQSQENTVTVGNMISSAGMALKRNTRFRYGFRIQAFFFIESVGVSDVTPTCETSKEYF